MSNPPDRRDPRRQTGPEVTRRGFLSGTATAGAAALAVSVSVRARVERAGAAVVLGSKPFGILTFGIQNSEFCDSGTRNSEFGIRILEFVIRNSKS